MEVLGLYVEAPGGASILYRYEVPSLDVLPANLGHGCVVPARTIKMKTSNVVRMVVANRKTFPPELERNRLP